MMNNLKDFYNRNEDFKMYVDRYCNQYGLTVDEALEHEVVKRVAAQYREKEETRVEIKRD